MKLQVLAQNVRRIRTGKQFSQRALAEAAGLSVPAIKSLELAKAEPRVRTVQAIAKALDVKLQDLFLPARELKTVRFRSTKRIQNRENILADIARRLEDFNYLEEILNMRTPFRLRQIRDRCSKDRIVECADLCRKKLGLSADEPIYDICGLLEHAGVKVLTVHLASNNFFGLSVGEEDGGPAVVVNVWERIPVERWIFSAAHELGHLMLHRQAYDVKQTEESKEEESEADLFAGHFLMPDQGFRKEWNEAAGLHGVDRVFKVKGIFHVSYKTILYRLIENGVVDGSSIWKKFQQLHWQRYGHGLAFKEEPMAMVPVEPFKLHPFGFSEDRFSHLVRVAVEKDKISLSRGAEILGIGIEEMQDLLASWEAGL